MGVRGSDGGRSGVWALRRKVKEGREVKEGRKVYGRKEGRKGRMCSEPSGVDVKWEEAEGSGMRLVGV